MMTVGNDVASNIVMLKTPGDRTWTAMMQGRHCIHEVSHMFCACREGTIPIYRFFNNRQDANHRHTPDLSVRRAMNNRGWVPEGINGVAFCSPI